MLDTSDLKLAEEFPPVSTAEWEATIRADLKGADYDKKLVWRTDEGIAVRPYYRAEDTAGLPPVPARSTQDWTLMASGAQPPDGAIRADRFGENGATSVQELGYGIAEAVERIVTGGADSIVLVLSVGSNFFFEIAKPRAARVLWAQVCEVVDKPVALSVQARTALSNKSIIDPYTNMLRATTEALSAAIGGVDALEVEAFGFPARLALNIQRVLKEESYLDRVIDPAAGSYYVEVLTSSLAAEAWKLVRQVEAAGGFANAKPAIDQAIAESRAAKEKAVASRRRTLVGVNNYPDINERLDLNQPAPAKTWRVAAIFEQIRLRSERQAAKTGTRPSVLLLTHGDVKMRMARAQFCQNFFGCGGFAIHEANHLEGAPDLVILCSSDPEYVALAQEICAATKAPVIVAGNPKEQMEALNAAGVKGYVHILSNAAETLTYWQNQLGFPE